MDAGKCVSSVKNHPLYEILRLMEKTTLSLICALALLCASCQRTPFRECVRTGDLTCEVTVYAPEIIRVAKYPSGTPGTAGKTSYNVVLKPQPAKVQRMESAQSVAVKTEKMVAVIDKASAQVSFFSADGKRLLLKEDGTRFEPAGKGDEGKFKVSQQWAPESGEYLYGLGQRQDPDLSIRDKKIHLWNENMFIYIPYFCSEKGYGVYWDNPGMSDWVDDGTKSVMMSDAAPCTDLYFLYDGGNMDALMAAVRKLGGKSTMFPLWLHGYWQCRERYHSTEELCEALRNHREMGIPLDCIVQDWQYWGPNSNWNSMRFENPLYERADTMIAAVHRDHAHLAISIWPGFGPDTPQYRELDAIGALLPFKTFPNDGSGVRVYNPFMPEAREIYWKHLKQLVDQGVDALWSDATEPEHKEATESELEYPTGDGSWRSVKNAYPIVTNRGIYENYRAAGYTKRAVQMTRSAAFGIQRYATFSWSGDVEGRWEVLRRQISSGLDYTLCGIPYWNTDIGGFFNGFFEGGPSNPAFRELQVRWMQWSVFVPVMRNHNCGSATEVYRFGAPGEWPYDEQLRAIRLRYRLMPYIYSLAGATVQEDGTILRPLVMDFQADRKALSLSDEYLFGPSFLVHPITRPVLSDGVGALTGVLEDSFETYLPAGTDWYDFHTGERLSGGQDYARAYSISEIPVFVRAGSLIPMGPDVQYTSEKPWDSLDIAVYPGADGVFTLYEDEGDGYGYEIGAFSTIEFRWDDAASTLTIGARNGRFPGMLGERDFIIQIPGAEPRTVHYTGGEVTLRAR